MLAACRRAFPVVLVLAALPIPSGAAPRAAVIRTWALPGAPAASPGTPAPEPPRTDIGRNNEDQPDTTTADLTHGIYFVPKDATDESLDTNGSIDRSMKSMRAWFEREMGLKPRVDRLAAGGYDISFVRGDRDGISYASLEDIAAELAAKGFGAENKRYVIYAALNMGTVCGEGLWPVPLVGSTRGPGYAAVYLDSVPGCGAREFGSGTAAGAGRAEAIAAQEWLHAEGMVEVAALHHCALGAAHVCTGPLVAGAYAGMASLDPENADVLFPFVTVALADKVLDRDHDDYLDHSFPHLRDLRDSTWLCDPGSEGC